MAFRTSRRRASGRSSRRPQWLVVATTVATLINALVRLFRVFGSRRGGTRTTSSVPPPVGVPPEKPTSSRSTTRPRTSGRDTPHPQATQPGSDGGIIRLFQQRRSDVVVTASGKIVKILPDDTDDSDGSGQHQVFLVELLTGITVKVCHNLAFGRAPVQEGQVVSFKGEYEYTERGGTIHWTHHDPKGWHEDGWIELEGKRYG
jgi:hypothetical protein